jgi:hypothetical protein
MPQLLPPPRITRLEPRPEQRRAHLWVQGLAGTVCELEGSSTLVAWNRLTQTVFTASPLELVDYPSPAEPHRFYRASLRAGE